jgi:predicted Zn-dependent protease
MRRIRPRLLAALLPLYFVFAHGCTTVPYTNRSQIMLMSESDDLQLGAAAYQEVLHKEKIVHDPTISAPVQRVGQRIAAAADKKDYQWEFSVIDDPKQANAFCLPGGKVAVYTGIFPIAHDDAGLAAVIGPGRARLAARRRTREPINASAGRRGSRLGGSGQREPGNAAGDHGGVRLGSQFGVALPFGRSQESEADHIGVILMAQAGYNPEAAIGLWERMEKASEGRTPPEWLSTHPSPATRITDLRAWMPQALTYFKPPGQPVAMLPSIPGASSSQEASAK